jgi:chromosome segregation ATPase
MQRLNNRRGSVMGIVVGLIVLLLIGGTIWFLVSKPFHSQVKGAFNQATQWTPENIKSDPVGYLTYALGEVGKTEKKLQASELGLRTRLNETTRPLDTNKAKKADFDKLLSELKAAYIAASSEKKWPAHVRGQQFDEIELKRKIVEYDGKLKDATDKVDVYSKTSKTITEKLGEVQDKLSEVEKLKNKLSTNMEIAKVNQSVDDIGSIDDQLNAIVDTSSALAKTAEDAKRGDDLLKPSGDTKTEDDFSKIMGKK